MKAEKGYTPNGLSPRFSSQASRALVLAILLSGIAFLSGCAPKTPDTAENPILRTCSPEKLFANKREKNHHLQVTATAYTAQSCGHRKNSHPKAANGECLTPDVSAIAVSPDLIARHGICMNQTVRLEGFEGEFKVMDLMSSRLQKTIDIYFGSDQTAARQWGRRTLTLSWD